MKKIIFSGIQPTGIVHIGNYFGAIKQWVDVQQQVDQSIFCIVDLHAITIPQDPILLRENILSMAALYIASGIDPSKSSLFVQSSRPEHSELAWILNCNALMGEINRMTQFKEKSEDKKDTVSVGLFDYPVLMAADILLYNTTHVPVGDDQKQHVELARNIAQRFNYRYGDTFVLPEPMIKKSSGRIMGLDNPLKKMSKSASSANNYIALTDTADEISSKIKKAVTDSGAEIKYSKDKPAIMNLIHIYSEVTGKDPLEIENEFTGKGYGDFKKTLADAVIGYFLPIQKTMNSLLKDKAELSKILTDGSNSVSKIASNTLRIAQEKIGLGVNA